MSSRRKKVLLFLATLALSAGVSVVLRVVLGRITERVDIGYDTTRATSPLHADGSVDYVGAFNAAASKGVAPADNAAILFRDATGPIASQWMEDALVRDWGFPAVAKPAGPQPLNFTAWLKARGVVKTQSDPDDRVSARRKAPWRAAEDPELAAWLVESAPALAGISAATERPRWFVPRMVENADFSLFESQAPFLGRMRTAADALAVRAMLRAGEGDFAGARADLLAICRLGRLSLQTPDAMEYLVGLSISIIAADADSGLAVAGVSAEVADALLAERDALPPIPSVAPVWDIGRRFETLSIIMNFKRFGPDGMGHEVGGGPRKPAGVFAFGWTPLSFGPLLRETNTWIDRHVDAAGKPTSAARRAAYDALVTDHAAALASLSGRRDSHSAVRSLIFGSLPSEPGSIDSFRDAAVATGDLSRVALMLAAHKSRTGSYPAALSDLPAAAMLPQDVFTDTPFRYRREGNGYILYSVGRNLRDDGGVRDESRVTMPRGGGLPSVVRPNRDDIVVKATK